MSAPAMKVRPAQIFVARNGRSELTNLILTKSAVTELQNRLQGI